jgi:hypothetical protein
MSIGNRGQAEGVMTIWIIFMIVMFILTFILDNPRTLIWGRTMEISIEPERKVVLIQPYFANVWVQTRPMLPKEQPEVITLQEKSMFGLLQGKITIRESR